MRRIRIFDTTLRDGEQAPGCSLYPHEKVQIAEQLAKLGVDVIEPGFPASSPGDFAAVQTISRTVSGVEICGFARTLKGDIDAAIRATQDAERRRLHLFVSSSQIHLDFQLRKTQDEVVRMAREMVAYAKQFVDQIEFSPMDATRTGEEFLFKIVEAVIEEGATIINLPDTVGYALPEEFGRLFRTVRESVRGGDRVEYSAHCHNDLGLAVANSLAAIQNGATQVELTINGVGERTGNCSLEELVMAIETRKDALGFETGIQLDQIYDTSRLVSRGMNFPIAHNKPIVGRNAFQHESGIHQDGLLKNRNTYEIMDPEQLGIPRSMIVLGKHSGRHALKHRVMQYGLTLSDRQMDDLFGEFKILADGQKFVSDEEIMGLVSNQARSPVVPYTLIDLQVVTNNHRAKVASITIRDNRTGTERSYAGTSAGSVEAIVHCLRQAMPMEFDFRDLEMYSLSSDETAHAQAVVSIMVDGVEYQGTETDTDTVLAVAKAALSACNQAVAGMRESAETDAV
ncbi:2-isopropylmalate synthase [Alicyclobacillus dauci]|uniref:2-isopropylmalate synthase n=1 Tax=Alicyclobacillus dauci TaxID=1475485 RepID=A0ABY6YZR8_9BACL|nr:2-isopropylmalate synthase [Alicyclobacillus dauci]WAH35763.1 2-isopropylmalate synthase [Alicyclobacillus dauci]